MTENKMGYFTSPLREVNYCSNCENPIFKRKGRFLVEVKQDVYFSDGDRHIILYGYKNYCENCYKELFGKLKFESEEAIYKKRPLNVAESPFMNGEKMEYFINPLGEVNYCSNCENPMFKRKGRFLVEVKQEIYFSNGHRSVTLYGYKNYDEKCYKKLFRQFEFEYEKAIYKKKNGTQKII